MEISDYLRCWRRRHGATTTRVLMLKWHVSAYNKPWLLNNGWITLVKQLVSHKKSFEERRKKAFHSPAGHFVENPKDRVVFFDLLEFSIRLYVQVLIGSINQLFRSYIRKYMLRSFYMLTRRDRLRDLVGKFVADCWRQEYSKQNQCLRRGIRAMFSLDFPYQDFFLFIQIINWPGSEDEAASFLVGSEKKRIELDLPPSQFAGNTRIVQVSSREQSETLHEWVIHVPVEIWILGIYRFEYWTESNDSLAGIENYLFWSFQTSTRDI